jgi:ABC-2 type transport system permease protein
MVIGIAMAALYIARRRGSSNATFPVATVLSKILVYILIYSVSLSFILGVVWPIFGFPYFANTLDVILLLLIYMVAIAGLGITLSHLFRRREAPIMLLLWTSIPILLLAGVSYPREAFPDWLYALGRILPSSSAVDAFIQINSMGASISDVSGEVFTLILLALLYLSSAIICENRSSNMKILA